MKPITLALSLVLACTSQAFCQEQPKPTISVSGSATVKVAPDEVYLNVGVETREPELATTVRQNNTHVASALAFLKEAGVPTKDIQTDFITIAPTYDRDDNSRVEYYVARKSIQIRLTKLDTLETVLTGLLANGINHVHGIDFRTTQLRKYRDQARLMATKAAKEKAAAIADELGASLDKASSVNIADYGGYAPASYWDGDGRGYNAVQSQNRVQVESGPPEIDSGTLSIGQISVSATVNVAFTLK